MTASGPLEQILVALAAAAICASLVIAIFPLLKRYAIARPNARSSHVVPTPQGAGIAVVAATLVVAATALMLSSEPIQPFLLTLAAAAVLIAAVGAIDDLKPIPVLPRLLLQVVAVGAVLALAPDDLRAIPALPLPVERALLLLAGLWFVNLVNFMDGIDWITVAEVVPVTAALVVIGAAGRLSPPAMTIAAALGGAMLGFAPFNRPVARVFLGDVGSLPIGLLLGWCLLDLAAHVGIAAALLLPLYYLADATLTLLRRLRAGERIWVAHRTHFYQRATDSGFSVSQVVGNVLALNVVLALLAIACAAIPSYRVHALMLVAGAGAVAIVLVRFARRR